MVVDACNPVLGNRDGQILGVHWPTTLGISKAVGDPAQISKGDGTWDYRGRCLLHVDKENVCNTVTA